MRATLTYIAVGAIAALYAVALRLGLLPIVVDRTAFTAVSHSYENVANNVWNPLEDMSITRVYITLEAGIGGCPQSRNLPLAGVMTTSRDDVIDSIRAAFTFDVVGGDMVTLENVIYVYDNDDLVFKAYFSADSVSCGVQSAEYGWASAIDGKRIMRVFNMFDVYCGPLLLLEQR